MTKKTYILALVLLFATYTLGKKLCATNLSEKNFASSDIKSLKIKMDRGDVTIRATDEKMSHLRIHEVSNLNCDKVKISLSAGQLEINSTNPPRGGCHVNYEVFIPKGIPVDISAGNSKVNIENMGELKITAGNLDLEVRNTASVDLQYASGKAEISHNQIPDYPYVNVVSTANGLAIFHLPAQSTVNIKSSGRNLPESDFTNCVTAQFPIIFNSAVGKIRVKKN